MKTKCQIAVLYVAMAFAAASVLGQTNGTQHKVSLKEISLGKIPATATGGKPLVSSDNRQFAFPVMHAGKWSVSLNGSESRLYTKVSEWIFSPDGKHFAFAARKSLDRNIVVLDGKESEEYEYLPDSLTFSPDSRRLAFGSANSNAMFVVVDGRPGPAFESICGAGPERPLFFFSSDGQKLAYGGMKKSSDGKLVSEVVIEGGERKVFPAGDGAVVYGFSPDGQHLAWGSKRRNLWQVVVGGKAEAVFDEIGADSVRFSPDSKQVAYFAKRGKEWMVLLNGKAGLQFETMGDHAPVFSADGRRLAYVGVRGGRRFVVVDGREGTPYDGIAAGSLQFSPDSRHVAFGAVRGRQQFVVRDGKEGEAFDGLLSTMFFSPDSQHLAWTADRDGRVRFVVDGKLGRECDNIADKWACFSPDSKHVAYGAVRENKLVVVVDDQEFGAYEGNLGTLAFEGPNLLSGLVTRLDEKFNFEILRLEIALLRE